MRRMCSVPIKLNLGCGNKFLQGFVNVDMPNNWCERQPDLACDVRKLELPNDYADEIHAYHVFEHFYRYEADDILADWTRILKPGGKMVLELPCLDKILGLFDYYAKNGIELNYQMTMWGLYGDPKYHNEAMVHRWCYAESELVDMMQNKGMMVSTHLPKTHQPVRDIRYEGIKQ